ncbi:MAG TPA: leucyl aminopeptidase family protein [Bacteroidales bacterium]|nr:leucyl aminopeptidase family protein [Bacteroidales bacterium]
MFDLSFSTIRSSTKNYVWLCTSIDDLPNKLEDRDLAIINKEIKKNKNIILLNRGTHLEIIVIIEPHDKEEMRRVGAEVAKISLDENLSELAILCSEDALEFLYEFVEGILLNSYSFNQYKSFAKKENNIKYILQVPVKYEAYFMELYQLVKSVFWVRDMVNKAPSDLYSYIFVQEIINLFQDVSINIEVLEKKQIESMKMGGLLGVNRGSATPPYFLIIHYNDELAQNANPYIFIGKGITFDTGGISLKPAKNMDEMKSDMAGGAVVAGLLYALSANHIPINAIGLIPITDNMPGPNSLLPGDIITMMNGKTVEVINTDAEGRLILADALCFAQKYDPSLVVSISTLTGAAHKALGHYVMAAMQSRATVLLKTLEKISIDTNERLVEFPLWDDYFDYIKSDIADIKNAGGDYAGAITAGKFLEFFSNFPFIHIDIGGPAYLTHHWGYWPKGGTGVGVRLLYNYLKTLLYLPELKDSLPQKKKDKKSK